MPRPWVALLGVGLVGCARTPPPPPPTPVEPEVNIPPGCEVNLAGWYRHTSAPDFTYEVADDGGSLDLTVWRVAPPDAGPRFRRFGDGGIRFTPSDAGPPPSFAVPDASVPRVQVAAGRLTRTADGFTGATWPAVSDGCELTFSTEVTRCDDGGLELSAEGAAAVDPSCHRAAGFPVPRVDSALQRLPSPP